MSNPRSTKNKFDVRYRFRGVSWDGYVVRVSVNEEGDPISRITNAASILVKMNEDDREGVHGADIGISISEHILTLYNQEIGDLYRGDHIRFNATM